MVLAWLRDPRLYIYIGCLIPFFLQTFHLYDQYYVHPTFTDTRIVQTSLQDIDFPAIFKICIQPGFDLTELKNVGYDGIL